MLNTERAGNSGRPFQPEQFVKLSGEDYKTVSRVNRIIARNSPLYAIVASLGVYPAFTQEYLGRPVAIDQETARGLIEQTDEFQSLREAAARQGEQESERKEWADKAIVAYLDFLSGEGSSVSKTIAVSSRFQEYVKAQAANGTLGPYFIEFLDILKDDDLLKCRHPDLLNIFSELDSNYFWFQDNKEQELYETVITADNIRQVALSVADAVVDRQGDEKLSQAVSRSFQEFTQATSVLIDGLSDKNDPNWRGFVLECLPVLYEGIRFENNPYHYKSLDFIKRAKRLCKGVDSTDWGFLINYLGLTSDPEFGYAKAAFDKQVAKGKVDHARAYINFAIQAYYSKPTAADFMPDEKDHAWKFVLRDFVDGKIKPKDLGVIPVAWDKLRKAYFSLPPNLQKKILTWTLGQPVVKDGKVVTYIGTWLESLMLSPILRKNPDLVAQVVSVAIAPEKDRLMKLEKRPDILQTMSEISKRCVSLAEQGVAVIEIISFWTDQMLAGKANAQEVTRAAQALLNFLDPDSEFSKRYTLPAFKKAFLADQLATSFLYPTSDLAERLTGAQALLGIGVYPTSYLISYVQLHGEEALQKLIALQDQTLRGQLDPDNQLQRDLEYVNFVEVARQRDALEYDAFTKIPFRTDTEMSQKLDPVERMETEAAAFEAATLYQFIQNRVALRRRLAVIGNERYGAYFVTEPLKPYLDELGVSLSTYYVHSSPEGNSDLNPIAESIRRFIEEEGLDDLVIVDGTRNSFSSSGVPRLPRSFETYRQFLKDYKITHWVPSPKEKIVVGSGSEEAYIPVSDQRPQIIFANPVTNPVFFEKFPRRLREHNPGFLDDPTTNQNEEIVLTRNGVKKLVKGRTEREFVDLVQDYMAIVLSRYILDPING